MIFNRHVSHCCVLAPNCPGKSQMGVSKSTIKGSIFNTLHIRIKVLKNNKLEHTN